MASHRVGVLEQAPSSWRGRMIRGHPRLFAQRNNAKSPTETRRSRKFISGSSNTDHL